MKELPARAARKLTKLIPIRKWRYQAWHWIHLNLEECEPELKNLVMILKPRGQRRVALDIGANCGYYSRELAKYFTKVYAFEINPTHYRRLNTISPKVSVVNSGLSNHKRLMNLYIPIKDKLELNGWASLQAEARIDSSETVVKKDLPVETLDSFNLEYVDFIKIDVEGHEMEVLVGSRMTLERNSPVILIEINPSNKKAVTEYLNSFGYTKQALCAGLSRRESANHLFIKHE